MYNLAEQGAYKAANGELGLLSPYSTMYELKTGNSYPWLGSSSTGDGVAPTKYLTGVVNKFGRKRSSKSKKHVGWIRNKNRIVKVYKFKTKTGRRLSNGNKIPKGRKVYKRKSDVPSKNLARRNFSSTRTKSNSKRHIGWIRYKNRAVRVYSFSSKKGRYFSNGRRIPSNRRVYRSKPSISNEYRSNRNYYRTARYIYNNSQSLSGSRYQRGNLGRNSPCYRRYNEGSCSSNPNCEWTGFNCTKKSGGTYQGPMNWQGFGRRSGLINPSVGANYSLYQYANNAATPSIRQLGKIGGVPAYPAYNHYNVKGNNYDTFVSTDNTTGMGIY